MESMGAGGCSGSGSGSAWASACRVDGGDQLDHRFGCALAEVDHLKGRDRIGSEREVDVSHNHGQDGPAQCYGIGELCPTGAPTEAGLKAITNREHDRICVRISSHQT